MTEASIIIRFHRRKQLTVSTDLMKGNVFQMRWISNHLLSWCHCHGSLERHRTQHGKLPIRLNSRSPTETHVMFKSPSPLFLMHACPHTHTHACQMFFKRLTLAFDSYIPRLHWMLHVTCPCDNAE